MILIGDFDYAKGQQNNAWLIGCSHRRLCFLMRKPLYFRESKPSELSTLVGNTFSLVWSFQWRRTWCDNGEVWYERQNHWSLFLWRDAERKVPEHAAGSYTSRHVKASRRFAELVWALWRPSALCAYNATWPWHIVSRTLGWSQRKNLVVSNEFRSYSPLTYGTIWKTRSIGKNSDILHYKKNMIRKVLDHYDP